MPHADPAGDTPMDDDIMTRLAHELADAIGGAVSSNPRVEACREKARAAGYELRVSLEAEIGFGSRHGDLEENGAAKRPAATATTTEPPFSPPEITANDRRFLRALRIAADKPTQPTE